MKRILLIMTLLTPLIVSARTNVGVSINIGEPGYYGQIAIGNYPPPALLYAEPVMIQTAPAVQYSPIYLRVPLEHSRNWRYYCGRYNACGRPVYFVRDDWYNNEFAPRYRHDHGHDDDRRGRGHAYGHDKHDRHDDHDDHHHHGNW